MFDPLKNNEELTSQSPTSLSTQLSSLADKLDNIAGDVRLAGITAAGVESDMEIIKRDRDEAQRALKESEERVKELERQLARYRGDWLA